MTVAQLRDLRTDVLTTRAGEWRTVVEWGENGRAHVDRQMLAPLREKLTGETATAAETRLQLIADNCEYARLQAGLVHAALLGLAEELAEVRARLRSSLAEAAEHGYPVTDDGGVSYPETLDEEGGVRYEAGTAVRSGSVFERVLDRVGLPLFGHPMVAQQLADRIGGALQAAADIDTRYARTLRELVCDRGLVVTDAMWRDAQSDLETAATSIRGIGDVGDIPAGGTPEENADWWRGLTEAEQDAFLALRPAEIGALDGLPSETRDMANRSVLQMEEARLRGELTEHLALSRSLGEPGGMGRGEWNERREQLQEQLAGIDAINARFAQSGNPGDGGEALPEAYLLGFDTEGLGHAIVANGNPDHADHTAIYVPGTGSNLSGAAGDINRMVDLWRSSNAVAGGDSVSTITWIGYDAPQDVFPDATQRSYAYDAAPGLSRFTAGMEAVQGGPDASHTTVIGHSYGSTVVGAAAKEGGIAPDDIIAVGSPGMLVSRADDLGIGSEHVWSMAAGPFSGDDLIGEGDKVPDLGRWYHGESDFGIHQGPLGIPYVDPDFVPNVPSDRLFGANRMETDSIGHSGYWDRGSTSLVNQSWVVVGRYDEVGLE
ncbi:alpha/beta hydrolase [Streptomyces sp. enrichment culture]|uniref:alpha/beta hydrolase n=1 Tax=Streptomyces sp. enrichment culture TaxID=1795815 RepID=UPI003F57275F